MGVTLLLFKSIIQKLCRKLKTVIKGRIFIQKKSNLFNSRKRIKEILQVAPFLFPGLILVTIFIIYPLMKGFQISFYDWNIMPGQSSEFIGFVNYKRAFNDEFARMALRNTVLYGLVTVPGQIILGMMTALMINARIRGRIFFRTLYYIPVVTSWVIVALVFKYLFRSGGGVINYILKDILHFIPEYVDWLQNTWSAMVAIMSLGIWKGIGWSMVIFLAALQSIPAELYEAASIDGATKIQNFFHITLPLIRPTVVFVLVMLIIGSFNVFISVFLMTGGGPMNTTQVMLSYMYKQAFSYFDFGYGSAISFILAGIILFITLIQMKLLRQKVQY